MHFVDIQFLQSPVSPALLMGDYGSQKTVQAINNLCNSAGGTVYSDQGLQHMTFFHDTMNNIVQNVISTESILRSLNEYRAITDQEQLCYVHPMMQLPIVCMPEIRKLHKEGLVYGFGIPVDAVPEEDVYGRLISNGEVVVESVKENPEDIYQEWIHRTDDPVLSESELDNIQTTRKFIREFLAKQEKQKDQVKLDPTDYPNPFNAIIK